MVDSAVETRDRRGFSASERSVLRTRRIDEYAASAYPGQLSAKGICDLIEAGVAPEVAHGAARLLSATAIIGFLRAGADLTDVDYDERFNDPRFLAEAGISASVANAFPRHLSEIDMVRLTCAGFGPRDCESLDPAWPVTDVIALANVGMGVHQAAAYAGIAGVPAEILGECVRAGVNPSQLAEWLRVVGPAIRTNPVALVQTALASKRLDDPVGFRFDLLRVAARSVLRAADDELSARALTDALLDIVHRRGQLSTTIPDSWTRERLLFVGPPANEVIAIAVVPDEFLQFDYGERTFGEAMEQITEYAGSLG